MDSIAEFISQKERINTLKAEVAASSLCQVVGLRAEVARLNLENHRLKATASNNNAKVSNRLNIAFMLGLDMSALDIIDDLGVSVTAVYTVKKLITV